MYHRSYHIKQSDPNFAIVAQYTQQVMQEMKLTRSPFHAEIILTPQGPRLVEIGARWGGCDFAQAANLVHGNNINVFDIMAHHYMSDQPYDGATADWHHYNDTSFVHIDGITEQNGFVHSIVGVEEVESLPEFARWVNKPKLHGRLRPTVDVFSAPYRLQLHGRVSDAHMRAVADQVKRLLELNVGPTPLAKMQARLAWEADAVVTRATAWMSRLKRS